MNRRIERYRNILDFALSSLLRRKGKNLSLLGMYTVIVFFIASLVFFIQALKREAALVLDGAPDLVVQRLVAGRDDPIPVAYGYKISAIRGVSEVKPRFWGYYYDPVTRANFTLVASGDDPPGRESIYLGSGVARLMHLNAGNYLSLRGAKGASQVFSVQKILASNSELVAADLIQIREDDFRTLFDFPAGRATDLAVSVRNKVEVPTVAAKIAHEFPDTRPILKSEMLRTYASVFDWRGGMVIVLLFVAVLSFVILAWDKATGLSAEERKEIGILKSIGWETGDVLILKSFEGMVISLTAYLAGVCLAYLHVFFFSAPFFEQALKGWSVLYPQFKLAPFVDPYLLCVLFFLTVCPYTVSTIVPSWLAATVDPDTAMRS
ncbi:MAG: FtsX-like permease family protein [Oryzomonas sp.]|uniref:ABC transporter permease n=1 Tax=Oryzomonas sp. TaxID=2855186 RepID=UPI00284F5E9E|nr:FtsX-like permease family protein [Oryzomonas sp.]MDR3581437.1 FtsX-like permease family protein [Oryzomonas sp.]